VSPVVKNIIRFAIIIALQVLVLNDVWLKGSTALASISTFKPFLHILFILMLPINANKHLLLILGLITGLVVDAYCNTYGLHAAACVLIAFIRPLLLNMSLRGNPKELTRGNSPSLSKLGFNNFLWYAAMSILVYMLYYFIWAELIVKPSSHYLLNVGFTFITTLVIIFVSQIFFISTSSKRR
jgi:hypothetical protein